MILTSALLFTLYGCLCIAVLNALGALVSRLLTVNFGWFTVGSIVIYSFTCVQIAEVSTSIQGVLAGCVLGLFDATIGVLIAKYFKPYLGSLEGFSWEVSPAMVLSLVVFGATIAILSIWIFT